MYRGNDDEDGAEFTWRDGKGGMILAEMTGTIQASFIPPSHANTDTSHAANMPAHPNYDMCPVHKEPARTQTPQKPHANLFQFPIFYCRTSAPPKRIQAEVSAQENPYPIISLSTQSRLSAQTELMNGECKLEGSSGVGIRCSVSLKDSRSATRSLPTYQERRLSSNKPTASLFHHPFPNSPYSTPTPLTFPLPFPSPSYPRLRKSVHIPPS